MRRKKWIIVAAPLGIALFVFIGGEVVMHLWNWLLPMLFGWRMITFWQAVGLLALCRILFGHHGWRGGGGRDYARRRIMERVNERWQQMTPEERERYRQSWRGRCGMGFPDSEAGSASGPSTGESKGQ
jgi:Ca2+/H+ antiporter, TMEM165/GDT1 family